MYIPRTICAKRSKVLDFIMIIPRKRIYTQNIPVKNAASKSDLNRVSNEHPVICERDDLASGQFLHWAEPCDKERA